MTQPKAFTLVETLVAIAILMIAIIGPFMEVQHALVASYIARDQLIANSLAEEGIEYVRTIRDGNYLMSRANPSAPLWFMAGLDKNYPNGSNGNGSTITGDCFSQTCYIDQYATTITNNAGALYINSLGSAPSYLYNQKSNGTATRFTRAVNMCYMQPNGTCAGSPISNEVQVTVTVSWVTEGNPQTTKVVDYIQNWL